MQRRNPSIALARFQSASKIRSDAGTIFIEIPGFYCYNPFTMKKRFGRSLFIIPVLYAGIIVLLVFLQFSDDRNFSHQFGGLTLRGRRALAIENVEAPVTELRLQFNGLEFAFSAETNASITSNDGVETRLDIVGYETLEDGFAVLLNEDVSLQFTLTGESLEELHIRPQIPAVLPGGSTISIPYSIASGAESGTGGNGNTLPVLYNSRTYLLAPPPRAVLAGGSLRLPGDVTSQTIRYIVLVEEEEDVIERWFADRTLAVSDQAYAAHLQVFIDTAYRGWRTTRFSPGSGRWSMRNLSPRFREEILVATLAEAWRRNEYDTIFTDMRRAADLHPGQTGLLSSSFLGNLRQIKFLVQEQDTRTNQQLLRSAVNRDPEIFHYRGLIPFALHRGSLQLAEEVIAFANMLDYRELDMFQTVGLMYNARMADNITAEAQRAFARFDDVIPQRLFSALIRTESGFFLQSTTGQIDVELSVLAGVIIEREGVRQRNNRWIDIGRNLVVSALSLADEEGFLPRVLVSGSGGFQAADGAFGPEEIYTVLAENSAYPRLVSLYETMGPGTWIWTVAGITGVQGNAERFTFTVQSPPNRSHYMIVQGIRPFSDMELFGLEWRNDPSFEIYARGRHYNAQTRSLLIKYTDAVAERPVVLRF